MKLKFLLLNLLLILSQYINAQDSTKVNRTLTDRFIIGLGIFYPSSDFKIKLNGSSENETVDFNKVFTKGNAEISGLFSAQWRFWEKWIMQGEYFGLKNESGNILEEDLAWRDVIFKEGTYAKSYVELDIYRILIGRRIIGGPQFEIGAGIGLHTLLFKSALEGEIIVNDSDPEFGRETANFNAPLPDIGIWGTYVPFPKWTFAARVDWFYISIDEYSGGLWDIAPSVNYQVFKNVGVNLAYHYFDLKLDVEKQRVDGNFDLSFRGPSLSVYGNF